MLQKGQRFGLAQEAVHARAFYGAHRLQRHERTGEAIERSVDDSHAAGSDGADDFETFPDDFSRLHDSARPRIARRGGPAWDCRLGAGLRTDGPEPHALRTSALLGATRESRSYPN